MNFLKGSSSRGLSRRFPDLKHDAPVRSVWQAGYGAKEVPPLAVSNVKHYIATQWNRLEAYDR
jgi:REP element-mobilizing transposase RayT